MSAVPIGVLLFRLGMVGLGAGMSQSRFERTGLLFPPVLVALATLAAAVLAGLGLETVGWSVAWSGPVAGNFAVQAVINAALGAALLPAVRRMAAPRGAGEEARL
ncbi:MAG: hypothetical protein HY534_05625 [Chloroflexi bacterium]|nr:hypothetical protein [Chloroflexota bacterium]